MKKPMDWTAWMISDQLFLLLTVRKIRSQSLRSTVARVTKPSILSWLQTRFASGRLLMFVLKTPILGGVGVCEAELFGKVTVFFASRYIEAELSGTNIGRFRGKCMKKCRGISLLIESTSKWILVPPTGTFLKKLNFHFQHFFHCTQQVLPILLTVFHYFSWTDVVLLNGNQSTLLNWLKSIGDGLVVLG